MANTPIGTGSVIYRVRSQQQLHQPVVGEAIAGTNVTTGSTSISPAYDSHRHAVARVSVFVPAGAADTDSTFTLNVYTGNSLIGAGVVNPARGVQSSSGAISISFNGAQNRSHVFKGLGRYVQINLAENSAGSTAAPSTGVFVDVELV